MSAERNTLNELTAGGDASAAAYVETEVNGETVWGVGIASSITTATRAPSPMVM